MGVCIHVDMGAWSGDGSLVTVPASPLVLGTTIGRDQERGYVARKRQTQCSVNPAGTSVAIYMHT